MQEKISLNFFCLAATSTFFLAEASIRSCASSGGVCTRSASVQLKAAGVSALTRSWWRRSEMLELGRRREDEEGWCGR